MRNLLPVLLLFVASCKQKEATPISFDFYPPVPDSAKASMLSGLSRTARLFNLCDMYSGVDSIEIRVNISARFDHINLIVLVCDRLGWKGYHYNSYSILETTADGTQRQYVDKLGLGNNVFMVKELNPLCGWKCFTDSISLLKLDSLPTQSLIKNYTPPSGFVDGDTYFIELATRHSYRCLSYYMPAYSSHRASKSVADFISLLKRQLGTDYNWPLNSNKNGK